MNCLKEAEYKLRDYNAKKNAIAATLEEITRLESESTCVRSAMTDSTPVRGGGNCREDAMLNNIAARMELKAAHDNAEEWLRIIDGALAVLTDDERHILDRFYINRQKGHVELLMDELHVEKSQVYCRKDAALRKFTLALYGVTET